MTSSSGSLRDLYSSSPSSWSFLPSPPTSSSSPPSSSSSIPKHEWSTRPSISPVFDLSPSLPYEQDGIHIDTRILIKGVLASAIMQYTSTALVMPWEVGKLLLQIQWLPRESEELQAEVGRVPEEDDEVRLHFELMELNDDVLACAFQLSEESSDEAYFQDPASSAPSRYPPPKLRLADEEGYVVRRSVLEEGTRPEYIMPISRMDGVWGMIKKTARWRNEGWFALWKGLLTSCITNFLSSTIQPVFHNLLLSTFSPSVTSSAPTMLVPLTAHVLTGLLLSPLDLVRTRLIAQSSLPRHRTYTGPLDALSQLLQHEGGLRGLYLHPHLLIPAALDNAVRPLIVLSLPSLLAGRLGINEDSHPLGWTCTEFGAGCLGALIMIPIETVRRRLQVQTRGTGKFKACVETRPRPYHGVVDTLWRILTEERSDLPRPGRKARGKGKEREGRAEEEDEGWLQNTGIGQLYRGLGMSVGVTAMVIILAMFTGGQETEGGWAEL